MPRPPSSRTAFIHEFSDALVGWLRNAQAIGPIDDDDPLQARSVIRDVSWSQYRSFLRAILRKGLRHTYCDGTLELMGPRPYWREWRKSIVRRFAQHLSSELNVNLRSLGRVPIVSPSRRLGLEPDEAFAITLGGQTRVRPNLVIEVSDGGYDSKTTALEEQAVSRMRVLREIGIAEVWMVQDWSVTICANPQHRSWRRSPKSQFFSGVTSTILSKNLARSRRCGENDAIRHLLYDVHPANC